jgi:tRNA1(Val) A37 N6-methylase TrmN6
MVYGTADSEARIFLVELKKGRKCDLKVEPPLIVYKVDGSYTAEAEGVLGGELTLLVGEVEQKEVCQSIAEF